MSMPRLLALDPGTRSFGMAVVQGDELLAYGVITIPSADHAVMLQTTTRRLRKLIERYQPTVLAIEQTFVLQASASFVLVVAKKMKATARRAGLEVYEYPPRQVRRWWCPSVPATRSQTAARIAQHYPHLARFVPGKAAWEQTYYGHLFDAIATGLYCADELRRQTALYQSLPGACPPEAPEAVNCPEAV